MDTDPIPYNWLLVESKLFALITYILNEHILCMCLYMHVHVCTCIMAFWKHIFYELASFSRILSVYESENLWSIALNIFGFSFLKICKLFLTLMIWFHLKQTWLEFKVKKNLFLRIDFWQSFHCVYWIQWYFPGYVSVKTFKWKYSTSLVFNTTKLIRIQNRNEKWMQKS